MKAWLNRRRIEKELTKRRKQARNTKICFSQYYEYTATIQQLEDN